MLCRAQTEVTEHANLGTAGTCTRRPARGTVGGTDIIHPARRRVDPSFQRLLRMQLRQLRLRPPQESPGPATPTKRARAAQASAPSKQPPPQSNLLCDCRCSHVRALNEFGICRRSSSGLFSRSVPTFRLCVRCGSFLCCLNLLGLRWWFVV